MTGKFSVYNTEKYSVFIVYIHVFIMYIHVFIILGWKATLIK